MIGAITPELAALLTSQTHDEGCGRLAAGRSGLAARRREDALVPDCDPYLRQLAAQAFSARELEAAPPVRRRLKALA